MSAVLTIFAGLYALLAFGLCVTFINQYRSGRDVVWGSRLDYVFLLMAYTLGPLLIITSSSSVIAIIWVSMMILEGTGFILSVVQ